MPHYHKNSSLNKYNMKTIWTIIVGLVAIMAVMMTLAIIVMFGSQLSVWVFIAFWTIIIYRILPKSFGVFGVSMATIGACVYFGFFYLSLFVCQPIHYLMKAILAICAVLTLLKGKSWGLWIIVATVYVAFGIYYLFYNNIIGPDTFLIMDRPVDIPAQWYYCYRFFWAGIYLDSVLWFSSFLSSIIIFIYIIYDKYKEKIINSSSQAL